MSLMNTHAGHSHSSVVLQQCRVVGTTCTWRQDSEQLLQGFRAVGGLQQQEAACSL